MRSLPLLEVNCLPSCPCGPTQAYYEVGVAIPIRRVCPGALIIVEIRCGPVVVLDIVDTGLALTQVPHDHGRCCDGCENCGKDCDRLHDGADLVKDKKCVND